MCMGGKKFGMSLKTWQILGPAFGRTDFSRIFIFEPPDFFADFLAGFFLLIFVGKSAQKNPPGKSPGKFIQQKSSNTFLQIAQGNKSSVFGGISRDLAGISWLCPKSLNKKKVCVQFSSPTLV